MTREQQDEAFATYAANLRASMDRHPAGKQRQFVLTDSAGTELGRTEPCGDDCCSRDAGTPIYDSIVLGQYEQPSAWARLRTATASWYSLLILALIVLWYLS